MKSSRIILLLILVAVLCGCGYDIPNLPVKEKDLSSIEDTDFGEMRDRVDESVPEKRVVSMMVPANSLGNINYAENTIKVRIDEFMKEYPDIEVQLEIIPCTVNSNDTTYSTQVAVRFASGATTDLISTSGVNICKYARAGYFEDLYPWMDSDQELSRDCYYPNIIKALEIDQKLYLLPNVVCYSTYTVNPDYSYLIEEELEAKETLTIYELKKLYDFVRKSLPEELELYPYVRYDMKRMLQEELYSTRFYVYKDKLVHIDSKFFDLLQFVKEDAIPASEVNYAAEIRERYLFLHGTETIRISGACFPSSMVGNGLWLQETANGDIHFSVTETYAMNSDGMNKEDAWTLMKYLSKDVYKNSLYNSPEYMPGRRDEFWNSFVPNYKEYIQEILRMERGDTSLLSDSEYIDGIFEQMDRYNSMLNYVCDEEDVEYGLINDVFEDYNLGLIDEQELMTRLQQKLEMHVNE